MALLHHQPAGGKVVDAVVHRRRPSARLRTRMGSVLSDEPERQCSARPVWRRVGRRGRGGGGGARGRRVGRRARRRRRRVGRRRCRRRRIRRRRADCGVACKGSCVRLATGRPRTSPRSCRRIPAAVGRRSARPCAPAPSSGWWDRSGCRPRCRGGGASRRGRWRGGRRACHHHHREACRVGRTERRHKVRIVGDRLVHSPLGLVSRSKTETPTSEVDGNTTVPSEASQPYALRLASFASPEQQAPVVQVTPMQQQPRA